MTVTRMIPLFAGIVAASLVAMPAEAGGRQNEDTRFQHSQRWQDDGQVTRRNSDRFEQWQGDKKSKRAQRRAERQAERKARRANRANARGTGGYAHAGRDANGALPDALQGYDLPDYIGGYNQPKPGRTMDDVLSGYDLPDYIGGYQQAPSQPSMSDVLGGYDLPDYIGGN